MSELNIPKEHMFDPQYGYVVDGMFLMSKWIRENTPLPEHKFKKRDVVVYTITVEVLDTHRDVDGTPLYELSHVGANCPEDWMRLATDKERNEY